MKFYRLSKCWENKSQFNSQRTVSGTIVHFHFLEERLGRSSLFHFIFELQMKLQFARLYSATDSWYDCPKYFLSVGQWLSGLPRPCRTRRWKGEKTPSGSGWDRADWSRTQHGGVTVCSLQVSYVSSFIFWCGSAILKGAGSSLGSHPGHMTIGRVWVVACYASSVGGRMSCDCLWKPSRMQKPVTKTNILHFALISHWLLSILPKAAFDLESSKWLGSKMFPKLSSPTSLNQFDAGAQEKLSEVPHFQKFKRMEVYRYCFSVTEISIFLSYTSSPFYKHFINCSNRIIETITIYSLDIIIVNVAFMYFVQFLKVLPFFYKYYILDIIMHWTLHIALIVCNLHLVLLKTKKKLYIYLIFFHII